MQKKKDKLIAIGEALIDFIPEESGKAIKDVCAFKPTVGGAPANVCGAFAKLGGRSSMITKLGNDAFGDKIVEEFKHWGIDCDNVLRTDEANTSLAFVALKKLTGLDEARLKEYLNFANIFCSVSVQSKGAIASYPTGFQVECKYNEYGV